MSSRSVIVSSLLFLLACNNDKGKGSTINIVKTDTKAPAKQDSCEYYESVMESKNANQRITEHEYLQLFTKDAQVTGIGAGDMEGGPSWTLSVKGKMRNDSTLSVEINYKPSDTSAYRLNEEWIMFSGAKRIRVKTRDPKHLGTFSYNKINFSEIPEYYQQVLKKRI